jgi:hypothetical protein
MTKQHKKLAGVAKDARLVLPMAAIAALLSACGGGSGGSPASSVSYTAGGVFQVGTTSYDPDLPAEPTLPKDTEVCATLEASNNLVSRPDG